MVVRTMVLVGPSVLRGGYWVDVGDRYALVIEG